MRKIFNPRVLLVLFLAAIVILILVRNTKTTHYFEKKSNGIKSITEKIQNTDKLTKSERVVISFVVCDKRFHQAINVVKSVLIFSKTPVLFVIFAEDRLQSMFDVVLQKWKTVTKDQFEYELQRIKFPKNYEQHWLNLFSKCAAQRLFIPALVPHIDSMIYVDTDTLFLGPAEELWHYFRLFNESQISAMSIEDYNPNVSWYPRFAKHPFYGKYGLNSGVMLMNLTRMREFAWVDYVTPIMLKWQKYIPWGDQDIINIIFHYHADAVYELSCRYNFRSDQCAYGVGCAAGASRGVFLVHGSRGAFTSHKQPVFRAIYQGIDEHDLEQDEPSEVIRKLRKYLAETPPSNCKEFNEAFVMVPEQTLIRSHTNRTTGR